MGEGEFGPVFKGVAQNIIKGEEQSLVAVKVLIRREGEDHLWPSLMEFANQMKLSSPFIASILGISADTEPFYVIYNYLDRVCTHVWLSWLPVVLICRTCNYAF